MRLTGQNESRPHIRKGLDNKPTHGPPWMWNLKLGLIHYLCIGIEHVKIQRTRCITHRGRQTTGLPFDVPQAVGQLPNVGRSFQNQDRVKERHRGIWIRHTNGLGLVDPGCRLNGYAYKRADTPPRLDEMCHPVADVGSKAESDFDAVHVHMD